jgi:CRISP-associated protein Cas1
VIGGSGFAADREKVRWQTETRADPTKRMEFATRLIAEKIAGSIETLQSVIPANRSRELAIDLLARGREGLLTRRPRELRDLLGIEGRAAAAYFKAWEGMPLRWKRSARRPVPDSWHVIGPRASIRVGKAKNRHAAHPLNAMINYVYAVLQAEIRIETVSEGYDPTLGVMHTSFDGSPALVLDLMEPHRPKVDRAVLAFALGETFSPADFVVRSDGTVRLAPELARRVCQLSTCTPGAEKSFTQRRYGSGGGGGV